ncbi:MAG: NUDIX hydrolase [Ilumatobacteraceae bacterium]
MSRRPGGAQRIPRPTDWHPGSLPPWIGRDLSVLDDLEQIERRLLDRLSLVSTDGSLPPGTWRPSAVLVGVTHDGSCPSLLLTRRADHLRNHAGEVSFPGGRMEPGESPHDAALREAHEEIALRPSVVRTLGVLSPLTTVVSDSFITPVVARVGDIDGVRVDPGEVARVFTVPVAEFVRIDTYSCESWITSRGEIDVHFFHLDDETVWGATARMIVALLDVLTAP